MKVVIEGKLYDTDTGELLASTATTLGSKSETLYKSPKLNHLFIHTSGEHLLGEPDRIRVVSVDEARKWMEKNSLFTVEAYEAFGVEFEEA